MAQAHEQIKKLGGVAVRTSRSATTAKHAERDRIEIYNTKRRLKEDRILCRPNEGTIPLCLFKRQSFSL